MKDVNVFDNISYAFDLSMLYLNLCINLSMLRSFILALRFFVSSHKQGKVDNVMSI